MSPPPNYPAAARRHKRDGDVLCASPNNRLENADHLYGFAAECALLGSLCVLHRAGAYPKLKLSPEGAVEDEDLRRSGHIKEVWNHMLSRIIHSKDRALQTLFQPFLDHRDGISKTPFHDWSVLDRYREDGFVVKDRVLAHQRAADVCISILKQVEQSYLRRDNAQKGAT